MKQVRRQSPGDKVTRTSVTRPERPTTINNRERQIDRKSIHPARRSAKGPIEEVHTTGTKLAHHSSNGEAICKKHTKEGSEIEAKKHGGWEKGKGRNWGNSSSRARA